MTTKEKLEHLLNGGVLRTDADSTLEFDNGELVDQDGERCYVSIDSFDLDDEIEAVIV